MTKLIHVLVTSICCFFPIQPTSSPTKKTLTIDKSRSFADMREEFATLTTEQLIKKFYTDENNPLSSFGIPKDIFAINSQASTQFEQVLVPLLTEVLNKTTIFDYVSYEPHGLLFDLIVMIKALLKTKPSKIIYLHFINPTMLSLEHEALAECLRLMFPQQFVINVATYQHAQEFLDLKRLPGVTAAIQPNKYYKGFMAGLMRLNPIKQVPCNVFLTVNQDNTNTWQWKTSTTSIPQIYVEEIRQDARGSKQTKARRYVGKGSKKSSKK